MIRYYLFILNHTLHLWYMMITGIHYKCTHFILRKLKEKKKKKGKTNHSTSISLDSGVNELLWFPFQAFPYILFSTTQKISRQTVQRS